MKNFITCTTLLIMSWLSSTSPFCYAMEPNSSNISSQSTPMEEENIGPSDNSNSQPSTIRHQPSPSSSSSASSIPLVDMNAVVNQLVERFGNVQQFALNAQQYMLSLQQQIVSITSLLPLALQSNSASTLSFMSRINSPRIETPQNFVAHQQPILDFNHYHLSNIYNNINNNIVINNNINNLNYRFTSNNNNNAQNPDNNENDINEFSPARIRASHNNNNNNSYNSNRNIDDSEISIDNNNEEVFSRIHNNINLVTPKRKRNENIDSNRNSNNNSINIINNKRRTIQNYFKPSSANQKYLTSSSNFQKQNSNSLHNSMNMDIDSNSHEGKSIILISLPHEVIIEVLELILYENDLSNIAKSSKSLSRIIREHRSNYKNLDIKKVKIYSDFNNCQEIYSYLNSHINNGDKENLNVISINFLGQDWVMNDIIEHISKIFPNLNKIILSRTTITDDANFINLKNLEKINISGLNYFTHRIMQNLPLNLVVLNLNKAFVDKIDINYAYIIMQYLSRMSNLKELYMTHFLTNSETLDDAVELRMFPDSLTSLHCGFSNSFSISLCESGECYSNAYLMNLLLLNLEYFRIDKGDTFAGLPTSITELNLSNVEFYNSEDEENPNFEKGFSRLVNLKKINLSGSKILTAELLLTLVDSMEEIDLEGAQITNVDNLSFQKFKKLIKLDITFISELNHVIAIIPLQSILPLSQFLKSLSLSLVNFDDMNFTLDTLSDVNKLLENLPISLEDLKLFYGENNTVSVETIAKLLNRLVNLKSYYGPHKKIWEDIQKSRKQKEQSSTTSSSQSSFKPLLFPKKNS